MSEQNSGLPSGWVHVQLEELGMTPTAIVDPSKEPNKEWELWSVPSFPTGHPEVLMGAKIGSTKQRVHEGNVLLCKINPRINRVWVVGEANGLEQIASSEWIVFRKTEVDPRFLMHRLREGKFREELCAEVSGVGGSLTRARPQTVKTLRISLPPLAEQRRIVAKIEVLQERSRRAREALSDVGPLLAQLRQSVLAAAFRGDLTADWRAAHPNVEPASELLYRICAERRRRWEQAELATYEAQHQKPPKNWKEKYKEPKPLDDSGLPALPAGWKWSNFNEISLIDGGLTKHEAKRSKAAAFVPLISVAAVQHGYIDSTQVSEIGLLPTDGDKGKLENNDLLIVEGNGSLEHIGRAALWDGSIDNARHQNHLIRVRPVLLDPRFSLHWVGSPRGRTNLVSEATSAAGLYNLSLGKVGRVCIPIPPLDEQTEIVKHLNGARAALRSVVNLQRVAVDNLNQLDQSILVKAFRGEMVPQDPSDEPASVLLERIRAQREQQAGATKQTSKTHRRNKMEKKSSKLAARYRHLVEVLTTKGQPMPPEQLLTESGYDDDSIEDFYAALREEIAQGRIRENRLTESDVMLEAVKQ